MSTSTMEVVGLSNNVEKCRKDLSEERFEGVFGTFFGFSTFFDPAVRRKFFLDLGCFCTKINDFYVKYTPGVYTPGYQFPVIFKSRYAWASMEVLRLGPGRCEVWLGTM